MRIGFTILLIAGLATASLTVTAPDAPTPAGARAVAYFGTMADSFAGATVHLQQCIQHITADSNSVIAARKALINCRRYYKRIEFFLGYFYFSESTVYNSPPKYEIEEPYMEYQHPAGMQVIEALLYEADVPAHRKELEEQAELIRSSAEGLPGLLYGFSASDAQVLESMRLELVRIIALHLSGYDAPLLKSGIMEAEQALLAFQHQLPAFKAGTFADSTAIYVQRALQFIQGQQERFDGFDRLTFLTRYLLPLQRVWSRYIAASGQLLQTAPVLNYQANHLFSSDALHMTGFGAAADTAGERLTKLGQQLFFEKALSGNSRRNCASCHMPDQYFADGRERSESFNGQTLLKRNTPSLLYAGYQHAQFWDGHANSLEQQVKMVMQSPDEMNADTAVSMQQLRQQPAYVQQYAAAFPGHPQPVTMDNTAAAIAAFIRSLTTMNAPFDRFLAGDTLAMNREQQQGFNVFMGKAQCATCHFAPVFNGLTPPLYQLTEFEVLGTTATAMRLPAKADEDGGRYNFFPITFYRQAFKTPTVRNAAATAPYMHNGRFATLEEVVDFYDKGGGVGLGLQLDNQTLSATPLELTAAEKKALVRFMEALTDDKESLRQYKAAR